MLALANCVLFFVVSGIQYWCTFYFVKNLHVPQEKGAIYFGTVALSSPVMGAALSGYYTDYWGGIYSSKIIRGILYLMIPSIIVSVPIPFIDNVMLVLTLFWLLLFFGAMILPILTAVILTKVEPEMRPRANSIANLLYELLGYFPAPIAYGYACQIQGGPDPRAGMAVLMFATMVMPVFTLLAVFCERRQKMKEEEEAGRKKRERNFENDRSKLQEESYC